MTIIKLFSVKTPYLVKEGYGTVKRRIFTSEMFFEVTLSGQKVTINKANVEEFGDEPKTVVVGGKKEEETAKVVEVKKKLRKARE